MPASGLQWIDFSGWESAVEAVALDVIVDGGWEQAGTVVTGLQPAAEIGRRDVFMSGGKQVDAGTMMGGEAERGQVVERESGAGGDDPLGEFEQTGGLAPAGEIEKAVGADEVEEGVARMGSLELGEGVDGVIGEAVGAGGIEGGGLKSEVAGVGAGKGGHGEAVGEGGRGAAGLERLAAGGGEEDRIQVEGVCRGSGDAEVAAVRGVEGAAEESYVHEGLPSRFRVCLKAVTVEG
jgi:hypothetical protein